MNAKKARILRTLIKRALDVESITGSYVTKVTKSREKRGVYGANAQSTTSGASEGGERVFRIYSLSYELGEGSSRHKYQAIKRQSSGRSVGVDYGRSPEGVRSPLGRLFPDSRVVDITPKAQAEGGDNPERGGAGDDLPEDVSGAEQAQAGQPG